MKSDPDGGGWNLRALVGSPYGRQFTGGATRRTTEMTADQEKFRSDYKKEFEGERREERKEREERVGKGERMRRSRGPCFYLAHLSNYTPLLTGNTGNTLGKCPLYLFFPLRGSGHGPAPLYIYIYMFF